MRERDDRATFRADPGVFVAAKGGRVLVLTGALVLAINLAASPAPGADSNWIAPAGDWSDANSWSAGEPNASINASVSNGGTATISQGGEQCSTLSVGSAAGESGTLSIVSGWVSSDTQFIGVEGSGVVSQTDGNNTINTGLRLGYSPGSSGTYVLSGKGRLISNGWESNEIVGYYGTGYFLQTGGTNSRYPLGVGLSPTLYLGYASGSSGTYRMEGNAVLNAYTEYVGFSGEGNFIQAGGNNADGWNMYIGFSVGAKGTYTLCGKGTLGIAPEYIGYDGTGVFTHTDGNNSPVALLLGYNGTASGTYLLSGTARLTVAGMSGECVGYYGKGSFTQSGGTNTVSYSLVLGNVAGSSGTYQLSGSGRLVVGNTSADASVFVGLHGTGVFIQTGGTHLVNFYGGYGSPLYLGYSSDSNGVYQLDGGDLAVDPRARGLGNEYIGYNGAGTFVQTDGNNTMSNNLFVGYGGTGVYRLTGPGRLRTKSEYVGFGGTGQFTQTDGNNTVTDALRIGYNTGGMGTYLLGGNGRLTALFELVGCNGTGSFQQAGGWNVVLTDVWVGSGSTPQGTYEISDGNLDTRNLYVGVGGNGAFHITDANACITVSGILSVGAKGSLSAVPGSAIHMTGSAFVNNSTDANLVAGLANLRFIYEGADANADPFEVAGWDYGADANGFAGNFGLGTLQLGSENGPGRVVLVDLCDNNPDSNGTEALYLQRLIVNPGSALYLNGIDLYVDGTQVSAGDGALYGGGFISAGVPEPGMLAILAMGGLALARRGRRYR